MEKHNHHEHATMNHGNMYAKLAIMALLSFIAMYVLMYSMVDRFSNVIPNVNQFYMAGLMAMPMVIIELLIMRTMYANRKLNNLILALSAVLLIVFYLCIRKQTAVTDKQFLKSMIPHHAAAILMVEEAKLIDPEVIELGKNIIDAQQKEIEQMKRKIEQLESK
jgi:uncharacterized protein (DUF305 family)